MPAAPPADAIAALLGPSTTVTRRVDIYEEDASTPFFENAKIVDGTVTVDGGREERRSFDMVLENIDGSLDNYPGGFWYDKVIKVFRGLEWDGFTPSTLKLGTDPLYALNLPGTSGSNARSLWLGSTPKGLYLPGTTGHYAGTPDHPSLSLPGDLDLRIKVTPNTYTAGGHQTLIEKGVDTGYGFYIMPTGGLQLNIKPGAGLLTAPQSTVAVGGTPAWLRATRVAASGLTRFYTSADGVTWTQLGDDRGSTAGAIASNASALSVGQRGDGSLFVAGVIKRAMVLDGIGGSPVLDVDFTDESQGWAVGDSNGATGIDATGKTVTINGASSLIRSTLDVTRDLELEAEFMLTDYTAAAGQAIVSKQGVPGISTAGYCLRVGTTGLLVLTWGDGAAKQMNSTVALPSADGTWIRVKVTLDVDDGAGNRVAKFYTSTNGGLSWTQLGTTVTTAGVTSITANQTNLEIGGAAAGTSFITTGKVRNVIIRDGIGGPVVASPDFDQASLVGQTAFTDDRGNAWSLFGTSTIVDTTLDLATGHLRTPDAPFHSVTSGVLSARVRFAADDWTPTAEQVVASKWATTGNQRSWRLSILTDGKLRVGLSTNGTNELLLTSSVALTATNALPAYFGVDVDIDNGAGGKTATFLTSIDGITWTELGTAQTSAALGTAVLHDSSEPIRIGATAEGLYARGHYYWIDISDDLRPIVALDFTSLPADTYAMLDENTGAAYQFLGDGLSISGGLYEAQTWETQIGEFLIDRIDTQDFPHTVHITGRDYTKKLIDSEFGNATSFAEGQPIETVIRTIATNGGIDKFIFPTTGQTLGKTFTFEGQTTRWKACTDIATAYGYELFFDGQGYMVLREYQDPNTSPVTFTFETGEFSSLAKYSKSASDTRIYNQIVVRGEATETLPVVAIAANHEPSSPTSIENLNRIKTYNYSSAFITTEAQAQAVADRFLGIHSLESFEVNLEAIVIPWLEATEIVEFIDPDPNPGDPIRFLLHNFDIPLRLGTMTLNTKRVTVVG